MGFNSAFKVLMNCNKSTAAVAPQTECIKTVSYETKVSVRVSPSIMLWWSEQYIC